jgi:hypothetical protein
MKPSETVAPTDMEAIKRANFRVYNLITLFLSAEEIAALADLLNPACLTDAEFVDRISEMDGCASYRFYLTGALGVGKSTTTFQLRNLMVLDEWVEPREPLLAKPWDTLAPAEKAKIDAWIMNQFRIKNDKIRHEPFAICIVDRPPMDPLVFTPLAERPAKAKLLLDSICPAGKWEIAEGCVILLTGDPVELSARVGSSGRPDYTPTRLEAMETNLKGVYNGDGVRVVDTRGRIVAEVTKAVSEIIHFEDYKPFKFTERLKAIK